MSEKPNILIIDDDKNFADSTNDLLQEKGFESAYVLSGQDGIKKLEEKPYDFVLLDMKMPVLNGLDTFREIKKSSPETVVIMCTAFSMDEMIEQSLKEGVYTVLRKPLDLERVVGMIKKGDIGGSLVMVADDDPNMRETLRDNLLEYGYQVTTASNGEEAIRLAQEKAHDILFIDVKIPPINGLEVFLEIKQNDPNAKVVMVTGYKQEVDEIVETAIKEGAYACIEKPFGVNQIVTVIEKIASIRQRGSSTAVKNIKALLVDDQPNVLESLGDMLEEHGYATVRCTTAKEALEKADSERPDIVIADIKLADGNGNELCQQIKGISGLEVKTIAYSGDPDAIDRDYAKEHSIDSFCLKTDGFGKILDTIKTMA